ncbi:MAG: hypothetical protein HQL48_10095 [Gammaproteobacteria bacterium]|nr:hypothetical protein [Gammaproteobacteria bacterium]
MSSPEGDPKQTLELKKLELELRLLEENSILNRNKLKLEVEKLEHEIFVIQHPLRYNPAYIVTLIFALAAFTTALINWNSAKMRDQLDSELQSTIATLEQKSQEMEQIQTQIEQFHREADNLRQANNQMRQLVNNRGELSRVEQQKVDESENASYVIYYRSSQVEPELQQKVVEQLRSDGYSVLVKERTDEGLSSHSTLYYYDAASLTKATALQTLLYQRYGLQLRLSKGAGQGIDRKRLAWTLVIHHLGEEGTLLAPPNATNTP